ncbi:family 16 glycosylhydrolase [Shimia ponticola]|uniref:family 16 glycosylhydrolase n=1 Tax=Shimia ponticola TaxID=2582893 RepID=UPI0011BDDB26|nr:family 16 glycosylhydrolase [Shimia ponticola]
MVSPTITIDGTDYTLTFQDEFSSAHASTWAGHGSSGRWNTSFSPHLDDNRWIARNGEGQYYVDADTPDGLPQTLTQANGAMEITAHVLTPAQQIIAEGQEYASGLLTTELTFSVEGGYVEICADVPSQQGFLSAFWLLPADGDWSDEIDVFEILGHDTDTVYTNLWDQGTPDSVPVATEDVGDGFHTYALHWTETTISWLIDGQVVRTAANTVTEDMYLSISLAVDTTWTGSPDATTDFSDSLLIDYIHVYEETADPDRNPGIPGDNSFSPVLPYGDSPEDEILYGSRWQDTIFGGSGDDTIYGRRGWDMLSGDDGNDDLFGQKGRDTLVGGAGNDRLIGGKGEDVLQGGAGTDHLWGGQWSGDGRTDTFVFEAGCDNDYVHDFEAGNDLIDLSALTATWADVSNALQDQGWATYLNLGHLGAMWSDMLFLVGVEANTLTQDDFLFSAGA